MLTEHRIGLCEPRSASWAKRRSPDSVYRARSIMIMFGLPRLPRLPFESHCLQRWYLHTKIGLAILAQRASAFQIYALPSSSPWLTPCRAHMEKLCYGKSIRENDTSRH